MYDIIESIHIAITISYEIMKVRNVYILTHLSYNAHYVQYIDNVNIVILNSSVFISHGFELHHVITLDVPKCVL